MYTDIDPADMILRDHLARDRTILANERTLLAYVRTTIALLAAGGTMLHYFAGRPLLQAVGGGLIALALVALALGV